MGRVFDLQDHAFAGIGPGTVAMFFMNLLDVLKVKFQVSTRGLEGGIGQGIWYALSDIHASEGYTVASARTSRAT